LLPGYSILLYALAAASSILPALLVAFLHIAGSWNPDDPAFTALRTALLVSLVLALVVAVWASIFRSLPRLDAWWWVTMPFGLGGAALLFAGPEMRPALTDLLSGYVIMLCSAFGWMIGAFRQFAVQGKTGRTKGRIIMICGAAVALLLPVILFTLGGYMNGEQV
jgi:hypothetical protein